MCPPAIDQYQENTWEIFNMINMIAGEHIPGSIKFNSVYASYRLNSGQTWPAIFIPLKCVNQIFLNISRYQVDSGKIHYGIKFLAPVATWFDQYTWSCLTAQIRFILFKGPGYFNIFKISGNVDELKAYRLLPLTPGLIFHFTLPLTGRYWES